MLWPETDAFERNTDGERENDEIHSEKASDMI